MSEFFNPNKEQENHTAAGTGYAEPTDPIKIVVDQGQPRFCSNCGTPIENGAAFCTKCGSRIGTGGSQPFQSSVQGAVETSSHNGPAQGAQFGQTPFTDNYYYNNSANINANGKVKDKRIALLLCLLMGWCGAHRYYEGKIASGVFYTLTFGILGIGCFIDFIILLFKPRWYNP